MSWFWAARVLYVSFVYGTAVRMCVCVWVFVCLFLSSFSQLDFTSFRLKLLLCRLNCLQCKRSIVHRPVALIRRVETKKKSSVYVCAWGSVCARIQSALYPVCTCENFYSAKLWKFLHIPDEKLNYRKFHNIHNSSNLNKFLVTEFIQVRSEANIYAELRYFFSSFFLTLL